MNNNYYLQKLNILKVLTEATKKGKLQWIESGYEQYSSKFGKMFLTIYNYRSADYTHKLVISGYDTTNTMWLYDGGYDKHFVKTVKRNALTKIKTVKEYDPYNLFNFLINDEVIKNCCKDEENLPTINILFSEYNTTENNFIHINNVKKVIGIIIKYSNKKGIIDKFIIDIQSDEDEKKGNEILNMLEKVKEKYTDFNLPNKIYIHSINSTVRNYMTQIINKLYNKK